MRMSSRMPPLTMARRPRVADARIAVGLRWWLCALSGLAILAGVACGTVLSMGATLVLVVLLLCGLDGGE